MQQDSLVYFYPKNACPIKAAVEKKRSSTVTTACGLPTAERLAGSSKNCMPSSKASACPLACECTQYQAMQVKYVVRKSWVT